MAPEPPNSSDLARNLILASASPRRAQLLREYGYQFSIMEPPIVEPDRFSPDVSPARRAEALSFLKASSVVGVVATGIILSGDTVVALGSEVFGKPTDRDDARRILRSLCGTMHHVLTGVTLLDAATSRRHIKHDSTAVTMKPMTDDQLEAYLDTDAWRGKAGAYGIQDHGDRFVTRVEGSFTNVVGLPMELTCRLLSQWGLPRPEAGHDPND